MKRAIKILVILGAAIFGSVSFLFSQTNKLVAYPEGFRHWTHVKSTVIGPENPAFKKRGGLYHIYANPKAMEGFKIGTFPEGSIFVFDLHEMQSKDGVITGGSRRLVDVMEKDSTRFKETGGWGFEEFGGESHTERVLDAQTRNDCFTCHAGRKENDFVFSFFRE